MRILIIVTSLLLSIDVCSIQSKEQALVLLDSANLKYQTTEYSKAIAFYHQIEEKYESSALYRNLGNSYFRMNDIPQAILYFEKALKLDPQNSDVLFNLEIANSYTVDRFEVNDDQKFGTFVNNIVNSTSANNWAYYSITGICFMFLFLAFTVISRNTSFKRFMFYMGIFTALLSFALIIASMKSKSLSIRHTHAIVMAPKADIKSEPNSLSTELFVLHEGSKVQILNETENWVEIRIPNGTKGWIPLEDISKI